MTKRCYYKDAYTRSFDAQVKERLEHEGQPALVLDQTYFYPTSGGQPADRGDINGTPVVDVLVRPDDGAIVHVLDGEVWSDDVRGAIDWERRFDHMQQHSGQHILSQAFIRISGAQTVGFHLSEGSVTIDLHHNRLKPEDVEAAEALANQIIWDDRPIRIKLVTLEQAEEMEIRRLPEVAGDVVRLVDVEDYDVTACGGTHVARTGAVGIIKILKLEARGDQLRVEFSCGKRALLDYRQKNRIVTRLAAEFTTGFWELEESIAKMREELKQTQRQHKQQRKEMMGLLADRLLSEALEKDGVRIIARAFEDKDPDDLKALAAQLLGQKDVVVLLGLGGKQTRLLFARSGESGGAMNELLKSALQVLGNATGGGSAHFAQGGGSPASLDRVQQALDRAERLLLARVR